MVTRRSFYARNILKVPKKLKVKTKDGRVITFKRKEFTTHSNDKTQLKGDEDGKR